MGKWLVKAEGEGRERGDDQGESLRRRSRESSGYKKGGPAVNGSVLVTP